VRDGRGLKTGFPDVIPLERADVLEDLKSLIDIHRLTDFTLHDRVVPTIELRRVEDELIIVFAAFVSALAANFSFVQLFNSTTVANLRLIAVSVESDTGNTQTMSFDTIQVGVGVVGQAADRRRSGLVIPASAIGRFSTNNAVAVPGSLAYVVSGGVGRSYDLPQKLLDASILPPGTGVNFATGVVNQPINVAVAYKVQQINTTRPAGV